MTNILSFAPWREHFERNRRRRVPVPTSSSALTRVQQDRLAWSLARFQIGETGEGRIVAQIEKARLPGVDADYRRALALFIAEEGRHAAILARLVRALGGESLTSAWSERCFRSARRFFGVRFKLFVMFGAEVLGAGIYATLAYALPADGSGMREALLEMAADEHAHLLFHRHFIFLQLTTRWQRAAFSWAWGAMVRAAAILAIWEHRRTFRALAIPLSSVWRNLADLRIAARCFLSPNVRKVDVTATHQVST